MNDYGIKKGQIYLAADNTWNGHLVVGDVNPQTGNVRCFGFSKTDDHTVKKYSDVAMDTFKLAMVRYYLYEGQDTWLTKRMEKEIRTWI